MDSAKTWGIFGTTDPEAVGRLEANLGSIQDASHSGHQPVQLLFFDTFDWRIFRKGWALVFADFAGPKTAKGIKRLSGSV